MSVLGYAFWVVAAHLFPASEVGVATALFAAMWLVVVISLLGLGETLVRFLPTSLDKPTMVSTSLFTVIATSVIGSIIFILGTGLWCSNLDFLKSDLTFGITFIFATVIWTILALFEYLYLAVEKTKYSFMQGLIWSIVKLLLLVVLAKIFVSGERIILRTWLISGALTLIVACLVLFKRVIRFNGAFHLARITSHYKFSLTSCLTMFLTYSLQMILPLVIISTLGNAESAFFYMDWSIAFLLCVISNSISSAMLARVSNDEMRFKSAIKKALMFFAIIVLPASVVIFVSANKLLSIFGYEYARHGAPLLRLLSVSTIFYTLFSLFKYIQLVKKRAERAMLAEAFVVVATMTLSLALLKKFGITGIGYAWNFSLLPLVGYTAFLLIRIFGFNYQHMLAISDNVSSLIRDPKSQSL